MRKCNALGMQIIKESEGLRLRAYQCPSKIWTIGYGHTHDVKPDDIISKKQADDFLADDIKWAESAVEKSVNVPLTDNQFSALVSLVFNIGTGNFRKSKVLEFLLSGHYMDAADAFMNHVFGGGKRLAGLERRRKQEADLFML